jgi:hypothetical protein
MGGDAPEIRATQTYRNSLATVKVLTIRLPDQCVTESAAVASGQVSRSDLIMSTNCAVWLSELERSLVTAGYRVVSWDTIHQLELGSAARGQGMSTYEAAQSLGVDGVIMINSLEANPVTVDKMEGSEIHYYESNADGEVLAKSVLPTSTRKAIRSIVERRFRTVDELGNSMLGATLDATMVLATSGESIWYYRRHLSHKLFDDVNRTYLFRGRGVYWRPILPKSLELGNDVALEEFQTVDRKSREFKGSEDPYKDAKINLIRDVSKDFVERFRSGLSG